MTHKKRALKARFFVINAKCAKIMTKCANTLEVAQKVMIMKLGYADWSQVLTPDVKYPQ